MSKAFLLNLRELKSESGENYPPPSHTSRHMHTHPYPHLLHPSYLIPSLTVMGPIFKRDEHPHQKPMRYHCLPFYLPPIRPLAILTPLPTVFPNLLILYIPNVPMANPTLSIIFFPAWKTIFLSPVLRVSQRSWGALPNMLTRPKTDRS